MRSALLLALVMTTASWADVVSRGNGPCPAGYSTQGQYCVSNVPGKSAVPKSGSCPSGYSTQGDFCVAQNPRTQAVPKAGTCPSGYSTQGNYCVKPGGGR